jgi:hypothetical protein
VCASLFTVKERESRLAALHRARCFVSAQPTAPAAVMATGRNILSSPTEAVQRFIRFCFAHYDRLLMYHDVWFTVTVVVGERRYLAVPATRTLYVPATFDGAAVDEFLREHVPTFIEDAMQAMEGKRKQSRKGGSRV